MGEPVARRFAVIVCRLWRDLVGCVAAVLDFFLLVGASSADRLRNAELRPINSGAKKCSSITDSVTSQPQVYRRTEVLFFKQQTDLCIPFQSGISATGLRLKERLVGAIEDIVSISFEKQRNQMKEEKRRCLQSILSNTTPKTGNYCLRTWDGILCWSDSEPGHEASQPCPSYIHGFNTDYFATRLCTENSTWFQLPGKNSSWTDYSRCNDNSTLLVAHMWKLRLMYNIGYGVSLVALMLAVMIMLSFRRLHCQRNAIHINLFVSFILRASVSFLKENLLVEGVGFKSDIRQTNHVIAFIPHGMHWKCKLFFTVFHYVLASNYIWIFIEAFYLHSLISVSVFSEKSGTRWYSLFGWTASLTFVIPWVLVRVFLEDVLCWNTNPTAGYFWIMRAPIVASIMLNFLFFLNVIRVLFTKLNAPNTPEAKKFRKLAKSTLVLIPLFGIHYIIFGGLPDRLDEKAELAKLYFDMFFNSLQGSFVALLFCFLNGEVQNEIRKKWRRFLFGGDTESCCYRFLATERNRRLSRSSRMSYDESGRPLDVTTVVSLSARPSVTTDGMDLGAVSTGEEAQPMISCKGLL